jgi:DNA replication protein DnaC
MMAYPLNDALKRLRLSGIMESYDIRLTQARENALSHHEWLELLLQDEIQRRENTALIERLKKAKFDQDKTLESFHIARYSLKVQQMIHDLAVGHYLQENRGVLIAGPTGTGKSHLAQAFGHQACRQGKRVRFIRAAQLFREMNASRADHSWERAIKRFTTPELLIIDDFGLTSMTFPQAEDLYEIIAQKYLHSSLIFTSNRKIEAWVDLFPDAAMGNAALDRITSQSHAIILEGESYRRQMATTKIQTQEKENNMTKTT